MARLGARSLLSSYCKPDKFILIVMVSKKFYYHPIWIIRNDKIINISDIGDNHIETTRSETSATIQYRCKNDSFRLIQNNGGFGQLTFSRYFNDVGRNGGIIIDTSSSGFLSAYGAPDNIVWFGLNLPKGNIYDTVTTIYQNLQKLLEVDSVQQYLHDDAIRSLQNNTWF